MSHLSTAALGRPSVFTDTTSTSVSTIITASSSSSSSNMAATQTAPGYHPPAFLDYNNRKLPQPIQLPPLSIPNQGSSKPDYRPSPPPTHSLPSIHQTSQHQPPAPRSQPRSYTSSAAPIEKLLSPHPYTPTRSDSTHSPSVNSPPRSVIESSRRASEKYSPESSRSFHHERYASDSGLSHHQYVEASPYVSPIEPPRPTFSNHESPASNYPSTFNSQHHRSASHPPLAGPQPPAPIAASYVTASQHVSAPLSPYNDHLPTHSGAIHQSLHRNLVPHSHSGPSIIDRSPLRYELRVRQQPIAARACGFGERDRRVIDPPPIIQLTVTDPKTGVVDHLDELRYSLNIVHCTLWNADGTGEETALVQPDRRSTRRLMGQLVASPSVAKDEHDTEGCFFCFPDLSCRTHGRYRLRFVLMHINPANLYVGGSSPILTEVLTDVFTVYTAKDFPGMRPSSALTRALKLQGCNIQVKKGNEKALARKRLAEQQASEGTAAGDRSASSDDDRAIKAEEHERKKQKIA